MASSIEPPFTFPEKQDEAVFGDALNLLGLGLVTEVHNPIDVVLPESQNTPSDLLDML